MKTLKQFIFTLALTAGLSLAVSAQKDDQKKPVPKPPPPVIKPGDKKPPKDEKPKKPGMALIIAIKNNETA